jgi:CheY-like chemotaxis protein
MDTMPRRVLVIDDNLLNANLSRIILTRAGYEVELAHNGFEALDAMRARAFDLALVDINMPGMSGCDLCSLVRAGDFAPGIKLVAHTAMAMPSETEALKGVGFDEILTKPASRDALLAAVGRQLA